MNNEFQKLSYGKKPQETNPSEWGDIITLIIENNPDLTREKIIEIAAQTIQMPTKSLTEKFEIIRYLVDHELRNKK